ncbi:MAG TPA: DUF255 domain-containing protein [Acidobacteriota bacterium]|nr:DUF255 domain-containing protein [Acidobacteriota bacterium]
MKILAAAALAATFLALSLSPRAEDRDTTRQKDPPLTDSMAAIHWLSYTEAAQKSQAEDKHMLIHFTTKTCGWCRKMERETYTDPEVVRIVNESFAPVQVWSDSYDEIDIEGYKISQRALSREEFGVSSYPQFWFVTPSRTKVGPLKGYLPPDRFIRALEFVRNYRYDTTRTADRVPDTSSRK